MIPVTDILAPPEACRQRFAAARSDEYKADVLCFPIASDKRYWKDMPKGRRFNPPPG